MCFKIALELQQIDAWTDFQRQRVPEFSRGYMITFTRMSNNPGCCILNAL